VTSCNNKIYLIQGAIMTADVISHQDYLMLILKMKAGKASTVLEFYSNMRLAAQDGGS
jgi:hypothetical protein